MRHATHRHILGVTKEHREALMGHLATALIKHDQIETTLAKAKALRPFVERMITLAKKAAATEDKARKLHYRRLAYARVRDEGAVNLLFEEKVKEFTGRPGGYTRILKLMQRVGDGAEMALIELIPASDEGYGKSKKKAAAKSTKKTAARKKRQPKAAGGQTEAPAESQGGAEGEARG